MPKSAIHPTGAAKPLAPYTPAVEASGFVFISGQIALKGASGELEQASIKAETQQVMENLGILLRAAGLGFDHLVKVTIFLSDMAHYAVVNEVYGTFFEGSPPAREAVAVKGLPRGANVEISAIAAR
jgi:2-iminobutanoate/2-iminopropanoate deaminase